MVLRYLISLLALIVLVLPLSATVTDLSDRKVEIRYQFNGAELVLFGAVKDSDLPDSNAPYDVVVLVMGPRQHVTVRRKAKTAGIWINRDAVKFHDIPGYYVISATRPLGDIARAKQMTLAGVGFDALVFKADDPTIEAIELSNFRAGFLRRRLNEQLFQLNPTGVEIVGEGLFRTNISLPANTPIGEFTIEAIVFQGGEPVAKSNLVLDVDKAGFERAVYDYANNWPFFYGLTAVFIAFGAGWLAGLAGKK